MIKTGETSIVRSGDGTAIAFERTGSGPALILVDAACCCRASGPMRELAAALVDDFTVFTYDRRGRGDSGDTLPYSVDREVEDLRALVEVAGGWAFVHGFSSGAALALHAALGGVSIPRLSLLEPPLADGEEQQDGALVAELTGLLNAGRRGDAVVHFNVSCGVPAEFVDGMRDGPAWPVLQAMAHTLLYDLEVLASLPVSRLGGVAAPTLVINSTASDERLRGWARGTAAALPAGAHRELPGQWHGVAPDVLASTLARHFAP